MHRRTLACALMVLALFLIAPAAASAWAPDGTAPIHPVSRRTPKAPVHRQLHLQRRLDRLHRSGRPLLEHRRETETNGCTSESLPLGTAVEVTGASQPGKLAYNSWLTMHANGESDENTCAFNDLALVQLNAADVGAVNPSVPGEGWTHLVTTLTPGIPGDSGSGFLDASGNAFGVLSTLDLAPLPGSNGVGDLAKELAYERANGPFPNLQLVHGTVKFKANLLEAILGA